MLLQPVAGKMEKCWQAFRTWETSHLPQWLFLTGVEHARDECKSGGDGRLADTQEETCRHESGKVLTGTVAHEYPTPQEPVVRSVTQYIFVYPISGGTQQGKQVEEPYTVTARYLPMGNRTMRYELGQLQAR